MTVWRTSKHTILCNEYLAEKFDLGLTVLDGGAAGKIFEPFDKVRASLDVILFEARESSIAERQHKTHQIPGGIWSECATIELHIANDPSTSSIYPPNLDFVKKFSPKIGYEARKTVRKENVQVYSLDYATSQGLCEPPHFIKLDVHSSEFESIQGSRNSLENCLGFLVETWNYPVHLGQKLSGELEALLNSLGYFQYYSHPNSRWLYEDGSFHGISERQHVVGSEILFFRSKIPSELFFKYLSLLELFGYGVHALQKYDDAVAKQYIHKSNEFRDALLLNKKMRDRESMIKFPLKSLRKYLSYLKNNAKYKRNNAN